MDFAWLAVVGVLLLLAGLSALGFDTLRQRHRKKPYDFPEIETTRLDIPASSPKSVGAVREPPLQYRSEATRALECSEGARPVHSLRAWSRLLLASAGGRRRCRA